MPLTHILVDFDNKQPTIEELSQLSGDSQRLWIFSSPHSGKFKAEYVQALLAHRGRAQLVHCTKAGHNAVDMHIALHIGRLIADKAIPAAPASGDEFVVVSGDGDFMPLLESVRELGYPARRAKSLKEALGGAKAAPAEARKTAAKQAVKTATKKAANAAAKSAAAKKSSPSPPAASKAPPPSSLTSIIDSLNKHPNNRPASVSTLNKWLVARQVPESEVESVVAQLQATKQLRIEGKKVIYDLGATPAAT